MRAHYKRLGSYIEQVNVRNSDLLDIPLVGLSIDKVFIPSIANTIGTNMANYKIIKRNQFAYGPVTSRNGEKITIALFKDYDKALISQAYLPFEVVKTDKLLPDYLMMWFSRPEFDRYARFKSHGSARETFDWSEMCDVMLPIPPIEEQEQIVARYQAVENKIKVNEQIIHTLEETAQALYREWFVDGSNDSLPNRLKQYTLGEFAEFKNGKKRPLKIGVFPVYGGNGIIDFTNKSNAENLIIIGRVGAYCGSLYREIGKCWVSDNAISATSKINSNMFTYYLLKNLNLNERSEGTGQPLLTQKILNNISFQIANTDLIERFENLALNLFKYEVLIEKENQKLTELKSLLLVGIVREN